MSIESGMPINHLILCCPLLLLPSIFPSIWVFSNESGFASGGQSVGVSASPSVLPINTQDWFPLGWTGWISLWSKGLSRVFSNTTLQKHQFFSFWGLQLSEVFLKSKLSFLSSPTITSFHDYQKKNIPLTRQSFVAKVMSLLLVCCLNWV